jgi:hypothetical protein
MSEFVLASGRYLCFFSSLEPNPRAFKTICSLDQTVKLWDIRKAMSCMITIQAPSFSNTPKPSKTKPKPMSKSLPVKSPSNPTRSISSSSHSLAKSPAPVMTLAFTSNGYHLFFSGPKIIPTLIETEKGCILDVHTSFFLFYFSLWTY